jgi:hypothetical protein
MARQRSDLPLDDWPSRSERRIDRAVTTANQVYFCARCAAATTDNSAGGTFTFNGIGTKIYGGIRGDPCPSLCGSRRATKWATGAFLPLFSLGEYRVIWLPSNAANPRVARRACD